MTDPTLCIDGFIHTHDHERPVRRDAGFIVAATCAVCHHPIRRHRTGPRNRPAWHLNVIVEEP